MRDRSMPLVLRWKCLTAPVLLYAVASILRGMPVKNVTMAILPMATAALPLVLWSRASAAPAPARRRLGSTALLVNMLIVQEMVAVPRTLVFNCNIRFSVLIPL